MKTPADRTIVFRFASHPAKDPRMWWSASLEFPPGSDENSTLPITVLDGEQKPIASAVFEFAGQRIKVKDGKGSITYSDFIKGKSSIPLWMHRKGLPPVPGGLTFE